MITENLRQENSLQSTLDRFFCEFHLAGLLSRSNCRKQSGVTAFDLYRFLFSIVFHGKSFSRTLLSALHPECGGKDAVYRFLNSPRHHWRRFLWFLSSAVVLKSLSPLTSENRRSVLIVDDSVFSRSRSKAVELLSRVHDHTTNTYVRGFRMLTLGWSDGNSLIPLAFSLLSSAKETNRLQPSRQDLDKRSIGYRRRMEALRKSPDVVVELIRQAKTFRIPARHVLFDSWFAFPSLLVRLRALEYHVVAMVKNTPKIHYLHAGKPISLEKLYSQVSKRRGRAKILAHVDIKLPGATPENDSARIVFVRDRNRSKQWLALISTDLSLSDEEVVQLYGKRWDIEVFFKTVKSYLKLTGECYSRSYDALVAHTTVVFSRYILLAIEQRRATDDRTAGGIFYDCCDELADLRFSQALSLVLQLLRQTLSNFLVAEAIHCEFSTLWKNFIAALPSSYKVPLRISECET